MISRKLLLLLTIFVYLNLMDIYTTVVILELGGKEINPLWDRFNSSGITEADIALKLSLTGLSVFIISLLYSYASNHNSTVGVTVSYFILIVLIFYYSGIIINNVRMLNFQIQEVQRVLEEIL